MSHKYDCQKAILDTLAYSAVFDYPLTFHQLCTYLISNRKFKYLTFKEALVDLEKAGKLKIRDGKIFLYKNSPKNWDKRKENTKRLLDNVQPAIQKLKIIPWIKLLALTGSIAAYNANQRDDVDIFIISQKNRVWLTRLFVVLILKSVGKYRTEKNPTKKVCPNIYIDETQMAWPKEKQNLYVAHEIIMMHPLINRDNSYFDFVNANKWLGSFLPSADAGNKIKPKTQKYTNSRTVDKLEKLLMSLQIKYMQKKKQNEITEPSLIHFNKNDWNKKILDSYEAKRSPRN